MDACGSMSVSEPASVLWSVESESSRLHRDHVGSATPNVQPNMFPSTNVRFPNRTDEARGSESNPDAPMNSSNQRNMT